MADEKEFPETIGVRLNAKDRAKLVAAKRILEKENDGVQLTAGAIFRAALYSFVARKESEKKPKEQK